MSKTTHLLIYSLGFVRLAYGAFYEASVENTSMIFPSGSEHLKNDLNVFRDDALQSSFANR